MTPQQSQKELINELNTHRVEASKLKYALNQLGNEKESWFKKREEFSASIAQSIKNIKNDKSRRDSLTKEVRELKTKRNSLNDEIQQKSKGLGILKKENLGLVKSLGIKEHPSKIKQQIERLEFTIETEPISFDKEKSIMKKIKELKNAYETSSVIVESDSRLGNVSKEIGKIITDSNEIHKLIQQKAVESQSLHEHIIKISAEIDKMKAMEEEAFTKFFESKKKFNEINSQLKEKLKAMDEIKEILDRLSFDKKERRMLEEKSFLKSKEEEVNEKIRRRQKLTTDDLLVFQKGL